ncbi:NUDIX domain-containing protein [Brevibacillus centrosporus]|uniref:NUDIX hydrolase n=1 Tax=Brevibacillus centrosporus TaxID=54910 RepID=UPI002E237FF2|nr:NUDIX domain-containing protein [Brevibacillus centrosporus]MED4909743.1 NUDIX domain-containing protein [Brevibacillus centrosporus]
MIHISQTQKYRASSLCIIWKEDSILLEQFPEEEGVITFRPVGGTIEYGEDSKSGLIREVKEEINQDLTDVKLLGIIENIYDYYGDVGHEFDFIYEAKLCASDLYNREYIEGYEGENKFIAVWMPVTAFRDNPARKLVPDGLLELLTGQGTSKCVHTIKHVNAKDIVEGANGGRH